MSVTIPTFQELKTRQRAERDHHGSAVGTRIHRALSWWQRAEQCATDDRDGQFIFLWIAFNAAYANETGEYRINENQRYNDFLARLASLDNQQKLAELVWERFPNAIRVLLNNHFVFQPFWDHLNHLESGHDWQAQFEKARRAAHQALAGRDTAKILGIVFSRLYTLRNQLIHGGATWGSKVNRSQLKDAVQILGDAMPLIIEIMLDNAHQHWGEACYPVVE